MSQGVSSIGSCMAFIAGAPATVDAAGYAALAFEASGEATQIGDVGPENEVITFNTVCDGVINKRLGATNFGQQTIELAYKGSNAAQSVLSTAAETKDSVSVRETLSSGDILYYQAYVASFKTQVGGSSDFLRASVGLEIDGAILVVPA